jgi:membrane protein implicated in regulation of membrane protease activity
MKTTDFSPKIISKNLKVLFADKKKLTIEIIFAVIPALFLLLIWLPFFSIRETPPIHYIFTDSRFIMWIMYLVIWGIAFTLYLVSRLTILKPFTIIFRFFIIAIEALYIATMLHNFAVFSLINFVFVIKLNVGFYLFMIHFIVIVILAIMPNYIEKLIFEPTNEKGKTNQDQSHKKDESLEQKIEPKEEPVVEEKPVEPEVKEEPLVVEEPKPEIVEEPKPKATKKPKPQEPKE